MNTELFQKVHESVELNLLDMHIWEADPACGTTRCMAGWAIYHTTGQPLRGPHGQMRRSVYDLAHSLGVSPDYEELGGELLGLTPDEAERAFYLSNADGAQFIRLAAQGRDDEAREFLDGCS